MPRGKPMRVSRRPAEAKPERRQAWEYMEAEVDCKERNNLGRDGWELVAVCKANDYSNEFRFFFKRPLTIKTKEV